MNTGLKKWFVWGTMIIAYMLVFFHRFSMGSMGVFIMKDFKVPAEAIGMLGAMYSWAYMLMQLPSGILADTVGPRITASVGMLVTFIGSVIFATGSTFSQLMVGRFIIGLGVSVIFISTLRIQASWFRPEEFTRMSGLTVFMGKIGALVAESPLVAMIQHYGWRKTSLIIGFFSLIAAVLIYAFVRNTPTGDRYEKSSLNLWQGLVVILKNKYTWFPMLVFFGIYASFMALSAQWGNKMLMDVYGLTPKQASDYVMLAILGHMIGAVFHGSVSDWIRSRRYYMSFVVGVYALTILAMIGAISGWVGPGLLLYTLFFFVGFTSAGLIISYTASKEVNPPRYSGIATSVVNMGGFLGSALARPYFGKILDHYVKGYVGSMPVYAREGYIWGLWFLFALALIALLGAVLTKETRGRNMWEGSE